MPAEPTKARLKRRSSRKDLEEYRFESHHSRELEQKRNRGEVSCAECRRLKIKCDKQIPCQSCQRRGCAALCPNGEPQVFLSQNLVAESSTGSLSTGQGTRFVLAATEHLHRRISSMSARIRQLEDALSAIHARHSSEPHPLLHDELINVDEREGEGDGMVEEGPGAGQLPSSDVLEAFGTLSISEHGISRFFGPTGGSESLLLANLDSNHASPESSHTPDSGQSSNSPPAIGDLSLFSQSFPFTPMGLPADVKAMIESHLPPYERTLSLCETYFEQVSWLFRGVTRVQLIDDMLPVIYGRQNASPGEDYSGPHDLALLFAILGIGSLVGQEPSNALGEHFHQISRAAISLQPVLEKPSIVTIQTLHLMSIYNAMSGSDLKSETSMEMTWSLITLASHLSQTIGLHRDSARWGLTPKMVQRRRVLFWDLFVADVWQSLSTGRPPSFSLPYIDCGFPQYGVDDGFGSSFEIWQYRFAAECVADVTARTLTAEAPSYTTIMELDRKVREFPLPEGMSATSDDLAESFQCCVLDHIRETILMYIHRSFFAQAIIEHPLNPLKSVYAPSFLAAYRASTTILKSVREQFNVWPNSCSRFWTMWTFAFSAAVVFGTVVTRGPRSPLAQSAMTELEQACILFSKASAYSIRAAKALPILMKLSDKARCALSTAQSETAHPLSGDRGGALWTIKQEDDDDELSIFAGHTRFVSSKRSAPLLSGTSDGPSSSRATISPPHVPQYEPSPPLPTRNPPTDITPIDVTNTSTQFPGNSRSSSRYESPHSLNMSHSNSSTSSLVNANANTWNPGQVPIRTMDQYMAPPPPSQAESSYSSQGHNRRRSALADDVHPESQFNWVTDVQQDPSSQGQSYRQHPRPSQRPPGPPHQQYHLHAAHANAVDLQPPHPHAHYSTQYPPQQHTIPANAHRQATPVVPSQHAHHQTSSQPPPPQPSGQYPMYDNGQPGYHGAPPNMELADLGLASRDSRLDERWGSFMADSGLLDDFGPRR